MADQLVPTTRTTPTMTQYAHALLLQWEDCTKAAAAVLWAQFALETGAGAYCWCWNLGNVKHVKGDGFDYMALKGVWEIINGKRVELAPTDPGSWFRVYPDLDTAMAQHFDFLKKHYAAGWAEVVAGDVPAFAHALRVHGYYTASEASYAAGMQGHFNNFLKATAFENAQAAIEAEHPHAPPPTDDEPIVIIHPHIDFEPLVYCWDDTDTDKPPAIC